MIARNVNEGQTVVASMSAQVLFQIATDLQQMQVEASIPEADIGKIRPGQPVTFTVDAYDEDVHRAPWRRSAWPRPPCRTWSPIRSSSARTTRTASCSPA